MSVRIQCPGLTTFGFSLFIPIVVDLRARPMNQLKGNWWIKNHFIVIVVAMVTDEHKLRVHYVFRYFVLYFWKCDNVFIFILFIFISKMAACKYIVFATELPSMKHI